MKIGRLEINMKWHKKPKSRNLLIEGVHQKIDRLMDRVYKLENEKTYASDDIHNLKIESQKMQASIQHIVNVLDKLTK